MSEGSIRVALADGRSRGVVPLAVGTITPGHIALEPRPSAQPALKGVGGLGEQIARVEEVSAPRAEAAFLDIADPEIVSKHHEDSEESLLRVFESAARRGPSIVLNDEIDSIAPRSPARSRWIAVSSRSCLRHSMGWRKVGV